MLEIAGESGKDVERSAITGALTIDWSCCKGPAEEPDANALNADKGDGAADGGNEETANGFSVLAAGSATSAPKDDSTSGEELSEARGSISGACCPSLTGGERVEANGFSMDESGRGVEGIGVEAAFDAG